MKKLLSLTERNRSSFFMALIVGILFSAISVAGPTISGKLVSAVVKEAPNTNLLLAVFLGISLLQILLSESDQHAGSTLKIRQKSQMRRKAFEGFSYCDVGRGDISGFVSFVNNDIPSIAEQYIVGTIDIIKCVSIILLSATSLFSVHWLLATLIIVISILIVVIPNSMRKQGGQARNALQHAYSGYNTTLQSLLTGLSILKIYKGHQYARLSLDKMDDRVVGGEQKILRQHLIVQGITAFLQVSKTVAVLVIGLLLISRGKIEVGGLVTALQLSEMVSAPIEVLAFLRHGRNEVLPLIDQYNQFLSILPDKEKVGTTENNVHGLTITHLTYETGGRTILKDISVKFEEGKTYITVGPRGSGKSYMLRLIARVGDQNYQGIISTAQNDIHSIALDSYYEKLTLVSQEPYLFFASIKENICLGRNIAREEYEKILRQLNLGALVERLHEAELTPELVDKLSGGERQRIALARAMVRKPSIYLLDEVTSALDKDNAELVENLILHTNAMVIHVCHKPSSATAVMYDKIYQMVDGVLEPYVFRPLLS